MEPSTSAVAELRLRGRHVLWGHCGSEGGEGGLPTVTETGTQHRPRGSPPAPAGRHAIAQRLQTHGGGQCQCRGLLVNLSSLAWEGSSWGLQVRVGKLVGERAGAGDFLHCHSGFEDKKTWLWFPHISVGRV